jgi:hypothetical protein
MRTRIRQAGINRFRADRDMSARRGPSLFAFTASQLLLFLSAGAWLFLTAHLSGYGESEEAVAIFVIGMVPMVVAYLVGGAIAFSRSTALRPTLSLPLAAAGGVLMGVLGLVGLFFVGQTSLLIRGGAFGIMTGLLASGLSGAAFSFGLLAAVRRFGLSSSNRRDFGRPPRPPVSR